MNQVPTAPAQDGDGPDAQGELAVRLLARHKDLSTETSGPPVEVMANLDPVGLESISITGGTPDHRVKRHLVTAERLVLFDLPFEPPSEAYWFAAVVVSRSNGARLRVSGSDPSWVRSTSNELKTEMVKGVPRWSWSRHGYMWFAYTTVSTAALGFALEPTLKTRALWLWLLISAIGVFLLGSMLLGAARRLLPGFELVPDGQPSKAAAVLWFLLALVAQVPVGILVNKMTQ